MRPEDFHRILTAFADTPADIDLSGGKVIVQVRDDLIEAKLEQIDGQLWVAEHGSRTTATRWIADRVARLPLLAERILSHVPAPPHYIEPAADILDRLEHSPTTSTRPVVDASASLAAMLGNRVVGATSVIYLTSDAGEGKTTLIAKVARDQAAKYKAKETDWLLLPVALGGRGFQRFDDAVIATLVNGLRFQLLYFEGFLELVKLGYVVPAFDGFEEVFIEHSSGEALSALGNLVRGLSSSGTALIAARKAYFEYQSFGTQAQLFDGMASESAEFGRVSLRRWNREKYLAYGIERGVDNASELYEAVAARFGEDHPLLTRAVLVRRFMDVAVSAESSEALIDQLGTVPEDYFFRFVDAIVEREAHEKWVDRSGEPYKPLLSTRAHHELLALVASEMWLAASEVLRGDVLDVVADLFAEGGNYGPVIARQIKERLKQHSLLANVDAAKGMFAFDHEDFRKFYLGEALGRALKRLDSAEVRRLLLVGALPTQVADAAISNLIRQSADLGKVLSFVHGVAAREQATSFVKENGGLLALMILHADTGLRTSFEDFVFPPEALRARRLSQIAFSRCHFQATALEHAVLVDCSFKDCRFERIELFPTTELSGTEITECDIGCLVKPETDEHLYDPAEIREALYSANLTRVSSREEAVRAVMGDDVKLVERALRSFLRATQLNEVVFRQRLAGKANHFIDELLPELISVGALLEVPYRGAGSQHRYRLGMPMEKLSTALKECDGSFDGLIRILEKRP